MRENSREKGGVHWTIVVRKRMVVEGTGSRPGACGEPGSGVREKKKVKKRDI